MAEKLLFRTVDKAGDLVETEGTYSFLIRQPRPNPPIVVTETYTGGVAYSSSEIEAITVYVYPKGYVGVNGDKGTGLLVQDASSIIQDQLDLKKQYVSSKARPR